MNSDLASHLFEREPPQKYIEEWTETLRHPPVQQPVEDLSVLVFRLEKEWFALPLMFLKEVAHRRSMHQIPHRSNKILLGVVNLNGELQLYVDLNALLGVAPQTAPDLDWILYEQNRMVAITKSSELWVFPVEEIGGIYHWNASALENVPVNISKSTANYLKGIMKVDDRIVGLLDEELLFSSLKRSISDVF